MEDRRMKYQIRRLEERIVDVEAASLSEALAQVKQGPQLSGGNVTVHLADSKPGKLTIYELFTCDSERTPISYRGIVMSANRETIHNAILDEIVMDYPVSELNDLIERYGDLVEAVIDAQIIGLDMAESELDLETLDIT